MLLRVRQHTPVLAQRILIKAPHAHADPVGPVSLPEQEAAAAGAEAARGILRGVVLGQCGISGVLQRGRGDPADAED